MNNDSVKRILLISSFVLFAIAMVFVSYYVVNHYNGNSQYFKTYNKLIDNELAELLAKQKAMDEKIKEIIDAGDYTIESPCVLENPYTINPLSALIIFNTKENRSVDVYINDAKVTTVQASKEHVIPVYGLYANSTNFIELKLSDGKSKTIEIKTTAYNDDLSGITFKEDKAKYTHTFVLGNIKSSNSILRGFDAYDNLMFYMDFGYFSSIKYTNDKFLIGYNSEYSKDTKLVDLQLEIDYLGRITSISKDTSDLDHSYNAIVGDKVYNYQHLDFYDDKINNYVINKRVDTEAYSVEAKLETTNIEQKLIDAESYELDYTLAVNGEYITFDFPEDRDNMNLLLVTRNTKYTYKYLITGRNMIKTSIVGDVSLYLDINGTYYSLLTTVNN